MKMNSKNDGHSSAHPHPPEATRARLPPGAVVVAMIASSARRADDARRMRSVLGRSRNVHAVEVGCIRALQRRRAKGLKDRRRLAMRGVHSGADFSERWLGLSRFAARLPAQDQQSDKIVHDRMRMTRMCVACPTPTLAPVGPDSSVRTVALAKPLRMPPRRLAAEALAAMHSTVTPAAASLAATKSENWNPGRRQHESLPNAAPGWAQ